MNNSQIAHAWAHNTDPDKSKSGSSFFFEGDTIYSYGHHFPIARNITRKGKPAVLFTTRDYSVTTAKHKSLALRAIPHESIFYTENVRDIPKSDLFKAEYQARMDKALLVATRAKANKQWATDAFERIRDESIECAKFFGWRWRIKADTKTLEKLALEAKAQKAKYAKEEKANRELCQTLRPQILDYWRKHEPAPADMMLQWHKVSKYLPDRHAALRLSIDRETIETTLGAKVPASDAVTVWRAVVAVKGMSQAWQSNGQQLAIGDFRVDRIEPNGDIKAGCHFIPYSESEFIAKALQLT